MAGLAAPRNIVSSLISSLQPSTTPTATTTSSNPLSNASNDTRKALLTLHVLFPNELLPALDLLDRGLVTRLTVQDAAQPQQPPNAQPRHHLQQQNDHLLPGLEPGHGHREVGGLVRSRQAPEGLGVVVHAQRQPPGLEPPDRLREVQPQGQGQVWAPSEATSHRAADQHPRTGYTQSQLQDSEQRQIPSQTQSQRGHRTQHQSARSHTQAPSRPQGQASRAREIQGHAEYAPERDHLLRPASNLQPTDQISNEATPRRPSSLPHPEESPLGRRAPTSPNQLPAPEAAEQSDQIPPDGPDPQVQDPNPPVTTHPRRTRARGDQDPSRQSAPGHQPRGRGRLPLRPLSRQPEVYVVRSGQVPSGARGRGQQRFGAGALPEGAQARSHYEVRVQAWSCSCPAFVFAAFPAAKSGQDIKYQKASGSDEKWSFGGLTMGDDMPVCKHLLACILVEYSALFSSFVEEREVSVEEFAGWAAGWGD